MRPGWCYINTNKLKHREVFALKLDNGSGTVQRFAQTHSTFDNGNPWSQAGVSPDGTKVLFASDWGDANNTINTYHVNEEAKTSNPTSAIITILNTLLLSDSTDAIASPEIQSWKTTYPEGDDVWIKLLNKPGNHEDWVGIYPANANNDWENMVDRSWARETSPTEVHGGDWYKFVGLQTGEYEARFFLNNTFDVEDRDAFTIE